MLKKNLNSSRHQMLIKLTITFSIISLAGCVNQNNIAHQKLKPVSNACQKIDLLINAYNNDFEQLKEVQIKSRISNIWKAKYHLIGDNCKIWSWGAHQTTYSCNTLEVNEEEARSYYKAAKDTLQQCLGNQWTLVESKRKHDDGLKSEYNTEDKSVTLSTHLVPSSGLFKSKWSIYYYIGKTN